ncbi:MAG: hypothetical protein BRC29_00515 [Nanohaloarchaea archaeon SW_7_43_1]|nr:MAG: hypothetical protein BRC29_00515 [Nanohaloarchaea archaeon SW_7_43_1]
MSEDQHPFVDEEARKSTTIVTKHSLAIPEEEQKYKKSERAWNWEKIVDLFFPHEQSPKRNKYAKIFLRELKKEGEIGSKKLNSFDEWGHEKGKSNLKNNILPKLRRLGIIKYEYMEFRGRNEGKKGRRKIIKPAKSFTSILDSMANGWVAFESAALD